MIKARRAIAGIAAGAAILAAAPVAANATAKPYEYLTVSNEGGVVRVSTQMPGQPLLGASVDTNTGRACVGFSYQMPTCVNVGIGIATSAQTILTVDSDPSDGRVGVFTQLGGQPLVAITYNFFSGALCAGFSYQVPICIQTN